MNDLNQIPPRDKVSLEDTWDLSGLYPDLNGWEEEFQLIEPLCEQIKDFEGKLSESADTLKDAVEYYAQTNRIIERLYVYSHLLTDQDLSNSQSSALLDRIKTAMTKFSAASSFLVPEILDIEIETLEQFLLNPLLKDYKRMLNEIVRYKPYTLSKQEESILAQTGEIQSSFGMIFSKLNDVDMNFGQVDVDGQILPLTHSTLVHFLKHNSPAVRSEAYFKFYSTFESHQHTLAANYSSSVKKDLFLSRVRGYDSTLSRALFSDNVDPAAYEQLINSVENSLAPLHRYYALRKSLLNLEVQELWDTYVPLEKDITIDISYEEATDILIHAFSPLGDEYVSVLEEGLKDGRWVDKYENVGKRSGAYSSGCYDSAPYILMNYQPSEIRGLFTLAHEAGHSMHSYLSRKNRPYQDANYSIFVAEVASTFNELLLAEELKKRFAGDVSMIRYLLSHQLDDIKATFYRQTMFAEFEYGVHMNAVNGYPLTLQFFADSYIPLLEKYFGPAVNINGLAYLECLRIPHFYSSFYVYKYATGLSAAISLANQVKNSADGKALENYLAFLKSGCTKHPLELLRDAGVDLTSSQPIEETAELFGNLLATFEGSHQPEEAKISDQPVQTQDTQQPAETQETQKPADTQDTDT